MTPIKNHILQLQELVHIRDEQKMLKGDSHLDNLNSSISKMKSKLPQDVKISFDRLAKKSPIVIVPVSSGGCAGCGMHIPISLIQTLKTKDEIQYCPNCAKMIYFQEDAPKNLTKAARRGEPIKVGIARFSDSLLMLPNIKASSTEEVIEALAGVLEEKGFVDQSNQLVESALEREAIMSTGFENGLAFPHVRGVEGGGLTLALATLETPIQFNPASKDKTNIVFFAAIPATASVFYLKLLVGITKSMQKETNKDKLLAAETQNELWKALVRVTKATIK
ncbi:MAG: PTS sugar transporter subunit IIA [Kiritimatiellae bacterium]|jgi:mannitol/fructose-specific phosphotransferase system IIA component (Ntr-type)|nr:PTS sugar transporter subunit IIA [Kiritimatiellia bacterium]